MAFEESPECEDVEAAALVWHAPWAGARLFESGGEGLCRGGRGRLSCSTTFILRQCHKGTRDTWLTEVCCVAAVQARADAFAKAVAIAIANTEALVAGANCAEGSAANAVAAAEGTAKAIAEAFALAVAEASNQNADAIAEAEATAIEVSAVGQRVFVTGLVIMHSRISL